MAEKEYDPAERVAILASTCRDISGVGVDVRIVGFLEKAGFPLTEKEIVSILRKVPKNAIKRIEGELMGIVGSPETKAILQSQNFKNPEEWSDEYYAEPIESAIEVVYEYEFEDEETVPIDFDFVDVDPETQRQILEQLAEDF